MKLPISVIILTYNEEINLPHCLESIKDHVSEIIVVDCGSNDKTLEIAEKYGARTVEHKDYKNQAQQFNWALDNVGINNPWIFRLDADEWVTKELWRELEEKLENTPEKITGYFVKRRVYFMGKWIKHGGYYPTWILRLFQKGKGRYEEREMDEHIVLSEGKTGKLKNDFADENHKSLKEWTAKHNDFSTREAREELKAKYESQSANRKSLGGQAGRKRALKTGFYMRLPLFCRTLAYFLYRYIIRLGFLDGRKGLIFHFLQGFWYRFLIDAKILESKKRNNGYKRSNK
jgi:glycosyltransferase involved in cell wall biosynthesis